jgi:hypothetical protein
MSEKQRTFLKALAIMVVCLAIGCGCAAFAIIMGLGPVATLLFAVVPVVCAMHALTPRIWRP